MSETRSKPFDIPKKLVWEAYQKVAANKGAAGVDGHSIQQFEADPKCNLFKLWNRLSSGSYFPPPVRAVEIPSLASQTRSGRSGAHRGRPHRADCGVHGAGTRGGAAVPPGFLRISAGPVGARRFDGGQETVLGERLGSRYGHPGVLRHYRSWSVDAGGRGSYQPPLGGVVCAPLVGGADAAPGRDAGEPGSGQPAGLVEPGLSLGGFAAWPNTTTASC